MPTITIHSPGAPELLFSAFPGQSFLAVLFESGRDHGLPLCAGAGLCGKCAIRFVRNAPVACSEDQLRFGAAELDAGWRLACRHSVIQDCDIELVRHIRGEVSLQSGQVLLVDLGTTRIKYACIQNGRLVHESALMNPQMSIGSEVMSRLRYALSSGQARAHLRDRVLDVVRKLVGQADSIVLVGNPTMILLLLDLPLEGLAFAPYHLPWSGGGMIDLGADLPPVYVPPFFGPFLGADLSAGLAALKDRAYPYLLADLGTNGEFVLAVDASRYVACSVPMGPTLEGVGLCCGSMAAEHVLTRVRVGVQGLDWDVGPLTGISGTGYVSLLAALRRLGVLSETGHFAAPAMPLGRKIAARIQKRPVGRVLDLENNVYLAERDVEEFLKAKAGVQVAVQSLLSHAGLEARELDAVYLAGALGEHVCVDDLIELGFFPEVCRPHMEIVGNTALRGAYLIHEDAGIREWTEALPSQTQVVELVSESGFGARFLKAMHFAWT